MLLMIDNYDSFTYNLVQYLKELGCDVQIYRNDDITLDTIAALKPDQIVISPGPGKPSDAGITPDLIQRYAETIPILGVCLGHQAIGEVFGAKVIHANQVMHGKISSIHHRRQGVFAGLNQPFAATRYHSLVLEQATLPAALEVTAWTENDDGTTDEIMGIRHRDLPLEGVQFHPESILTEQGHQLLTNFLRRKIS